MVADIQITTTGNSEKILFFRLWTFPQKTRNYLRKLLCDYYFHIDRSKFSLYSFLLHLWTLRSRILEIKLVRSNRIPMFIYILYTHKSSSKFQAVHSFKACNVWDKELVVLWCRNKRPSQGRHLLVTSKFDDFCDISLCKAVVE